MEFLSKKGNMNLKSNRKQLIFSLWWFLEACIFYYYFASLAVSITIIALLLISLSCILFVAKSHRVRAIVYLLLSLYSIFSLFGACILYFFSMRYEQYILRHIAKFVIAITNVLISFKGFWHNWERSLFLE